MAAGGQDWEKFKNKMKEKDSGKSAKELGTIVIQRLSAEVSGKAQKYSRVGAREFVSFEDFDELSISNIKKACMKHYGMLETMLCDVLAGEQGPSCSSVKQLPNLKVIHVRFIEGKVEDARVKLVRERRKRKIDEISEGENAEHGKAAVAVASLPQRVASQSPSKFVPRSLSVVEMLRLGKIIPNTTTSVEIFNFDMSAMAWTGRPTTVEFSIESEPFGTGGFRKAFKATSNDRGFQGSTWVVKRYLEKASGDIIAIGQTLEEHTKKEATSEYPATHALPGPSISCLTAVSIWLRSTSQSVYRMLKYSSRLSRDRRLQAYKLKSLETKSKISVRLRFSFTYRANVSFKSTSCFHSSFRMRAVAILKTGAPKCILVYGNDRPRAYFILIFFSLWQQ